MFLKANPRFELFIKVERGIMITVSTRDAFNAGI